MTRFARAKGSKASNERTPEDGTPWEVMKEQLIRVKKESEEAKKQKEAEKQRIENYENFLKERKVEKRPATWCDFPVEQMNVKADENDTQTPKKKKKKNKNKDNSDHYMVTKTNTEVEDVPKKKKKKNKQKMQNVLSTETTSDVTNDVNGDASEVPKKKSKGVNQSINTPEQQESEFKNQTLKNKKKNKKKHVDNSKSSVLNIINDKTQTDGDEYKQKKNKLKKTSDIGDTNISHTEPNTQSNIQTNIKKKNKKKLENGKPVRRKEINDKSFQLIINGKEVELVRFDGFPIMKKDAERLAELKKNMIKKGIPKSEVQRTMKLERRRAEKALARVKRDVCYNCRKGGHNLSDCPELKSKIPGVDAAEGVCFKCGSTEHRQFECKVQKDNEFRFASCFICKEQGHIARQCPDNPKGLYPNGGCCKLCGDVTHLRKDCPTANNKKEETSMKLQTLDSTDNLEDIGLQNKSEVTKESSKLPKKIKF